MAKSLTRSRPGKPRAARTAENLNHHLWLHGRIWWVYCAINPTPRTKDKLRRSLGTESLEVARFRRDELFRRLHADGLLGRIRALPMTHGGINSSAASNPTLTWQKRVDLHLAVVFALGSDPENLPDTVVGPGKGKLQLCC